MITIIPARLFIGCGLPVQRFAHARRGAALSPGARRLRLVRRLPMHQATHRPMNMRACPPSSFTDAFLISLIPSVKISTCFPLSYGRIRSSWLYCCKESICFTAEPEEKTFASVRSILFCTAIMGVFFFLSVKSWISCAFPTATFIQLQIIAVKPHGHKQNYHWLSMVKTIGNALDCTIGIKRTKDSTVMVIPRDRS